MTSVPIPPKEARPVRLTNTGEVFPSITAACKKYPFVNPTSVSANAQGKRKRAGRMPNTREWLVWEYVTEDEEG